MYESLYGNTGRNLFRAPFQVRFDMSLGKEFQFSERYRLRFNFDAFNLFNHPDFDAPNNDVDFFPYYEGPPSIPPKGSLGIHPAHDRQLAVPATVVASVVLGDGMRRQDCRRGTHECVRHKERHPC